MLHSASLEAVRVISDHTNGYITPLTMCPNPQRKCTKS